MELKVPLNSDFSLYFKFRTMDPKNKSWDDEKENVKLHSNKELVSRHPLCRNPRSSN